MPKISSQGLKNNPKFLFSLRWFLLGVRESSSKVPIISQGAKSCYLMSSEMDKKVWDAANPEAPDGRCEIIRISKSQAGP